MVHDNLWEAAGMDNGFLCIGCLEARLGRGLTAPDFTAAIIDMPHSWGTPRLALRKRSGGRREKCW